MTDASELFEKFKKWVENEISQTFDSYEFGIADQSIEDIAWLRLKTKKTISGIKVWSTGTYYCEILTLEQEEPEMAVFGQLEQDQSISNAFATFIDRLKSIESYAF